jgi:hypothetical protein
MKKIFSRRGGGRGVFLMLAAVLALGAGGACQKSADSLSPSEKAAAEAKAIVDDSEAAAEAAAKAPAVKVEPKMNDTLYIEISARFVLIHEKFKDEPERIEPEMDKVCEKLMVTRAEYEEFKKALAATPEREGDLSRKIQDKMQALEREYK